MGMLSTGRRLRLLGFLRCGVAGGLLSSLAIVVMSYEENSTKETSFCNLK